MLTRGPGEETRRGCSAARGSSFGGEENVERLMGYCVRATHTHVRRGATWHLGPLAKRAAARTVLALGIAPSAHGSRERRFGHRAGQPQHPFLLLFVFYLFPAIKFIHNNEPHIKWIHTEAKHQTKTNIFQHDASIIFPLGFY